MIVGEDIFVMLLVEKFFQTFTKKEIWVMFSYLMYFDREYR
jgi:predicted lactoylglutathione lyase